VTRWDILRDIVQLDEKNTKRKTRGIIPMQLKMKRHPQKMIKERIEDYVLISALSGSVSPGEDTWLIDSGASKHMTGQRDILSCLSEKKFS
jgi:hypothetical protein